MFGFDMIRCRNCGTENHRNNKFCSNCGTNISGIPPKDGGKEKPVSMQDKTDFWSRNPQDFARRFELVDIKGTLRKNITIEQGTKAIFLQGGKFFGELVPGNYDAGGLLKKIGNLNFSEKVTVVILDDSDTRLNFEIENLRTKEAFNAGVKGTINLNIENPIMFFTAMMKSRDYISLDDLKDFLLGEMTNIVQAKIKQFSFEELYGNLEIKKEIQQDFEYHMRTTLSRLGIKLIHLPYFDYDESYWDEIIKGKGGVGLDEKREDIKYKEMEIKKRERARVAEEEINKLRNEDEIKKFIDRLQKEGIIREREKIELQQILQENLHDMMLVRVQIREKLAHTHGLDLKMGSFRTEIQMERESDLLKDEIERREIERDRIEAEQGIEMLRKLKGVKREDASGYQEIEERKLKARSAATDEALLSLMGDGEGTNVVAGQFAELAKMKAAKGLTHEQILALQAKDSVSAAKALEAKYGSERTEQLYRERMVDHQKFQDTMVQMTDRSADRSERMAAKSMEQMGATAVTRGQAQVPTTTVIGGGFGGAHVVVGAQNISPHEKNMILCHNCEAKNEEGAKFCTSCGEKL